MHERVNIRSCNCPSESVAVFVASQILFFLSPCSTFTIGSSTWHPRTTTTLSTSSAVLGELSAWRPLVWCSSMTCCRTWKEASRPRSCGSAFLWRWQPSPREPHCTEPGLNLQHWDCHSTEPSGPVKGGHPLRCGLRRIQHTDRTISVHFPTPPPPPLDTSFFTSVSWS